MLFLLKKRGELKWPDAVCRLSSSETSFFFLPLPRGGEMAGEQVSKFKRP